MAPGDNPWRLGRLAVESSSSASPLRCEHCGDVIGVYEPLVELNDGTARETSRAAEPRLAHSPRGSHYHADCFERLSLTQ